MGVGGWIRVLDTVAGLAASRPRRAEAGGEISTAPSAGPLEALNAKLAGVVVAALKEAFDRDKTRMDLERETIEADRARAERALQAELRRQAAERTLTHLRLIAVFSGCMLLVSGALSAWIPGMRAGGATVALAGGWAAALGALGCVFAAWPQVNGWAAGNSPEAKEPGAAAIAPWLLLVALALTGASVLLAGVG
jgi:hypothetical protein